MPVGHCSGGVWQAVEYTSVKFEERLEFQFLELLDINHMADTATLNS